MTSLWYQRVNVPLPNATNVQNIELRLSQIREAISCLNDTDLQAGATTLLEHQSVQGLLAPILSHSPYLSDCIIKEIQTFTSLLTNDPDIVFNDLIDKTTKLSNPELSKDQIAKELRIFKRRASLIIAIADITQYWNLFQVTGAISRFAQTALCVATDCILRIGHERGFFVLENLDTPSKNSGYIVLGMGKLGARELNYSSDIDLIILFDPERIKTKDKWDLQKNMVRLTKYLVQIMDERTKDGYVFRTDLRLRPDPGSTPLAISTYAAETYYESVGQNWERAAMIKARPMAGDIEAGEDFLRFLTPFMWRKYMDFAAIQDIHAIKRQINTHKSGFDLHVAGHNVKLGRGGIREIEFFAQTQQLIWGGRVPDVRVSPTCKALQALVNARQITQRTCDELCESYDYLRTLEHRIQMIQDEQTHSIPEDENEIADLASFMGYRSKEDFEQEFLFHLQRVDAYFTNLFADPITDKTKDDLPKGNLVFTGGESDPATLKHLEELGFSEAAFVDQTIRGWHHARYRATRSTRARQILTDLMPVLIKVFADQAQPDLAFRNFDHFLSKLPSGVQLFSMFQVNPHLLDLVAEIMGEAPRLADHLARHSNILEYVLTPAFFKPLAEKNTLKKDLENKLELARDFQDILDLSRRWANDRKFQIGVQTIRQIISTSCSGWALSDVADCVIETLLPHVTNELAQKHGVVEGGDMCVIALGKAGSRDMTATSDLDLVFVYEVNGNANSSNGERPLGLAPYYARLSQRLINALSAPTADGTLYEVDMRLRPSGNAGPIASSFESFQRYYEEAAWTWEHMALSRARVICGHSGFREKVEKHIKTILQKKRDPNQLLRDIADMRERMDKEFHTDNIWNVKYYRGGIVDIDFIAQYLLLVHAAEKPKIIHNNTVDILKSVCETDLIDCQISAELLEALELWNILQSYLRMSLVGEIKGKDAEDLPQALKKDLIEATNEASFDILCKRMKNAAQTVQKHYHTLISQPAEKLQKQKEEK